MAELASTSTKPKHMAFTYLSPLKHDIVYPKITIKPCLAPKSHSSNPNFLNIVSPITSGKIHAATTNVTTKELSYQDEKFKTQEEALPAGLEEELMPKHVAFILDGNRRWAVEKGLPPMDGHAAMRITLRSILPLCSKLNIKSVSLYAFSTENWIRPTVEVDFLMEMYEDVLRNDTKELLSLGCRITLMGNKTKLPKSFQKVCTEIEEISKNNTGTHINYGINYSGKHDILQACRSITTKVKDGILVPNQINETHFKQELYTKTNEFPYPDLVIRTSGEIRLSNFMLWQMAYSELYFTKKYFPDFGEDDLIKALLAFQETRRRV
ncbi:hypothetical protein L1987_22209 [Smallanthus sonchifolius]|uniref:Uncharacterized protein n=1 Tax=Smallanthus sonchifolius TaxID=185202 RepID=A0ACB9IE78_9ASTR|nr:hypothetical protein L1987_22209 [Smallanthus sonchifolius]